MTDKEFQKILESRLEKIKLVLARKASEYSRGDRLHNFKRASEALRITPERACIGFLMKHIVSILDMVDDLERDIHNPLVAWDEKIGDAINYLCLLEGIVTENSPKGKP